MQVLDRVCLNDVIVASRPLLNSPIPHPGLERAETALPPPFPSFIIKIPLRTYFADIEGVQFMPVYGVTKSLSIISLKTVNLNYTEIG